MKAKLFISLLLLQFFSHMAVAQFLDWQWARGSSGPNDQEGWAVASDRKGNVYETGFFNGSSATFGTFTLQKNNNSQGTLFLVKYSSTGAVRWAKGPSNYGASGQAVATDTVGNVFLTGQTFGDSIAFDGTHLLVNNHVNPGFNPGFSFVVKYDSSGNVLWCAKSEYSINPLPTSITTDLNGNSVSTGIFYGDSISFGGHTLHAPAGGNALSAYPFIVKYDPSGSVLWAETFDAPRPAQVYANGVAADGLNNFYVTGSFQCDSIHIGNIPLYAHGAHSAVFVAAYDPAGTVLWARQGGGDWEVDANGICTDANRNIYITGAFWSDSATFGAHTLHSVSGDLNNSNFFLAKYDAQGNALWAQSAGAARHSAKGYSVATDTEGQVYVAGTFTGTSGPMSTPYDTIIIGTTLLREPSFPMDPMFLFSYDSSGHNMCAVALPSGGDDQSGICVDRSGNVYLGGDYLDSTLVINRDSLHLNGEENMFIIKFKCTTVKTGIPDIAEKATLDIYPNPMSTSAMVKYAIQTEHEKARLIISDLLGRMRKSINLDQNEGEMVLKSDDLSNGIYLCTLQIDGENLTTYKIILQR